MGTSQVRFRSVTWIGAEEEAIRLLEKLSPESFDSVVEKILPEVIPASIRSQAQAAFRRQYDAVTDPPGRLRILLKMAELGDAGVSGVLRFPTLRKPAVTLCVS